MYNDIPLSDAMICWNSPCLKQTEQKRVCVVRHPTHNGEDRGYTYSDGACWHDWKGVYSDSERLLGLLGIGMKLVSDYSIPFEDVHKEFMNIPEYRRCLDSPAFTCFAGSMAAPVRGGKAVISVSRGEENNGH